VVLRLGLVAVGGRGGLAPLDGPGLEIVDGGDDLHLPLVDQVAHHLALRGELLGHQGDVGVDGVANTADDKTVSLLGVPNTADVNTKYPLTNVTQNTPRFSRYKTFEATMNKRMSNKWSAQIGGSHTWAHDFPGAYPNTPNGVFDENTTRWDFKLSGTYEAPYGLRVSPLVRHQAGANFARQISVGAAAATAAGAIFSGTINVEPLDSRRHDNITVVDLRIDRGFRLGNGVTLRGMFDLFNITNSNAVETRTITTGTAFLRPTAVLAPRTARLGARLSF